MELISKENWDFNKSLIDWIDFNIALGRPDKEIEFEISQVVKFLLEERR